MPPQATACPECGADDQTGWSDAAQVSGLNLPDDNFDYNDFVKREFDSSSLVPRGIHWFWWIIALGGVVVLVALWLG